MSQSFCPNCNKVLNVSKTKLSQLSKISKDVTSDSDIGLNYDEIVKKLEENKELTYREIELIDIDVLQQNATFQKSNFKSKIKKIITDLQSGTTAEDNNELGVTRFYFVCEICRYSTEIPNGKLVSSWTSSSHEDHNIKKLKNKILSSVYPHTRAYLCKNKKCPTITDGKPNDAIFFDKEPGKSFQKCFVCCACTETWYL